MILLLSGLVSCIDDCPQFEARVSHGATAVDVKTQSPKERVWLWQVHAAKRDGRKAGKKAARSGRCSVSRSQVYQSCVLNDAYWGAFKSKCVEKGK